MTDKKIITQKERNYIETLYLNFNIEDASTHDADHATLKYYNIISYMTDTMFPAAKYLAEADGRSWYQFKNYRMGIMSYDKAKIANQFNCVIQYEQSHLWELDKDLNGLDLPFDVDKKHYHIKRIDITKIAKHKEDYTVNHGYLSPYREYSYFQGTHYLGNRKNGNVFRIYDKTKELMTDTKEHPINYKKIALMSEYFGDIEDLYTYELELTRKYLKGSLGIETLAQLDQIYAANKNIVGKIRFYKDNDKNRRLIKQGKRERLSCKVLTDFIEYQRVTKKHYKPSFSYAVDQMVKTADKYLYKLNLKPTDDEYIKFANAFLARRVSHKNKDMVINYEDTLESQEMDKMTAKFEAMRYGQSNELEIEAKRYFGKFVSRRNAVAEIKV